MTIARLDRMAVVLMPREPIIDWANSIDLEDPVWADDIVDQANVYFIPHFETLDEAQEYVRLNFDEFFCNELSQWFDDESLWPKDRTYEMFADWFDAFFDVVVFDTQPRRFEGHRN